MYKKEIIHNSVDNVNIPPSLYEEIKRDYLCKKEKKYGLYRKYYLKYKIDKDIFMETLNNIKSNFKEPIPNKKKNKRKNNPYSFHDKHPNSYQITGVYYSLNNKNPDKNNGLSKNNKNSNFN